MGHGGEMGSGGDEHDENRGVPGDDDGPDYSRGALPHPLDRVWLHPSELSALPGSSPAKAPSASRSAPRSRPIWATPLVAGAVGAILTLAVLGATGSLDRSASGRSSQATIVPTSTPIAAAKAVAVAVAESVVAVSAHERSRTRRGSGVCVRRTGEILTSDRVIGEATKIEVTTSDGVVHRARVIGRDPTTDLALLGFVAGAPNTTAVPPKYAIPASFASRSPQAGDTAWVVGAPKPGDSVPWMSSGLVASTDSLVAFDDGPTTSGLLETAAASGAASSGGALVNGSGDVTGIVLSPVSDDRMTYAVPISTALSIASSLRDRGYVPHGALGIAGINAPDGPTVTKVIEEGPAARAGLRVGDILAQVDGHDVDSMDEVMALIRHDRPGQSVAVQLQRGSSTMTMQVELTAMLVP